MRLTEDDIDFDAPSGWPWTRTFAAAFDVVWGRLPRNACVMLLHSSVRVQLVEELPPHENRNVWAESHRSGTLRFARRCCEGLPHELLQTLVAHELGHLFRYALGCADWNMNEPEADLQCLNWGFDMQRLRLLPAEGGITK
jgi:hypothetical protein